jgi:hypothetical protein
MRALAWLSPGGGAMGLRWPDGRDRRGRRVTFRLDEWAVWDLALRLRTLPPEYLAQVSSFVAACEFELMLDRCAAPDAGPATSPEARASADAPPGRSSPR